MQNDFSLIINLSVFMAFGFSKFLLITIKPINNLVKQLKHVC